MEKLTLIVATYNRADKVTTTLDSIALQDADPASWGVIIVNNNSTDNTVEVVEHFISQHPEINIRLITETRQGLSYARNCGIEGSQAPIIAIIDDDEIIVPRFISTYIDFFDTHPDVAAGGGAIIAQYLGTRPRWISRYTEQAIANPLDLGSQHRPFPRGVIPGGGNMAIRRSAIERYGAFDVTLGRTGTQLIGGEESNLFERLRRAGEQVWWVAGAEMYHLIPDSKLQRSYLDKLWFNIGVSHMLRGRIEGHSTCILLLRELVKWIVTLAIAAAYTVTLRPSKGRYLILMRWQISRGVRSTTASGGRRARR